jgi:thiamine transport system permease protein
MKEFNSSRLVRYGLLFYFLIPYFIFIFYFKLTTDLNFSELWWAFKNSVTQSVLTALIVVALSIPLSQGLLLLPEVWQSFVKRLLIIPQILPALYSILIAFSVLNPFPMGTPGIVFIFVLINLGFATLMTLAATQEKLANLSLTSEVFSLRRSQFFTQIYLPLLKHDLVISFFIIFIFCLSSFSIPLIVGGGKGTNLEVLIYEKIFVEQNWSVAFSLCIFQSLVIFLLSLFVLKNKQKDAEPFLAGSYLKSYMGLALVLCYLGFYLGGYFLGLIKSFDYLSFATMYVWDLADAVKFTTKALIVYIAINFLLLGLWLYDFLANKKFNLATNLISVSTVLVGFSFYLVFPVTAAYDLIKITVAMSILFFPSLFKLFLQKPIEDLKQQILVAEVCGLSKLQIIIEIIFRQISKQMYLWISFLVVWFISEYAVLKSLGVQTQTLGLLTEGFLSSYRLPLSYLMSFFILIYWAVALLFIYYSLKVAYVAYKKFTY